MTKPVTQPDLEEPSYIPWVPKDMEWFLAELIQEFNFANGDAPLVWVNTVLIRASSLDEAYEKSLALGANYNESYKNTDDEVVTVRFRGLRDLLLIYEKLEDGAEILYSEYDEITEAEIAEMVTPKEQLGAYIKHSPSSNQAIVADQQEENDGR